MKKTPSVDDKFTQAPTRGKSKEVSARMSWGDEIYESEAQGLNDVTQAPPTLGSPI